MKQSLVININNKLFEIPPHPPKRLDEFVDKMYEEIFEGEYRELTPEESYEFYNLLFGEEMYLELVKQGMDHKQMHDKYESMIMKHWGAFPWGSLFNKG